MTDQGRPDVPKILAAIMWTAPGLTIRTGFAYLRMRRDLQKSARVFYQGMIDAGMPIEQARQLREKYADNLSTHSLAKSLGISLPGGPSFHSGK